MKPILKIINLCPKDIPRLDLGDKRGLTDYIDFINSTDMSHSLMRGMDTYGRLFLAIKVSIYDTDKNYLSDVVGTIFERYSSNSNALAYGTCYRLENNNYFIYDDSRVRDYDYDNLIKRLTKLFNGEMLKSLDLSTNMTDMNRVDGNGTFYVELSKK